VNAFAITIALAPSILASATDTVLALFLVPLLLLAAFGAWSLQFSRSKSLLEGWATKNGLEIVNRDYCWFYKGPFIWTSSRNQSVFRVTARDKQGNLRSGWVRLGGWFLGLSSDRVEVRWDN
jgi:hypothetical protein